jgi:hypothetical protein
MFSNRDELLTKITAWLLTWMRNNGVTVKQILGDPGLLDDVCDLAFGSHPALRIIGRTRAKTLLLKAIDLIPSAASEGQVPSA